MITRHRVCYTTVIVVATALIAMLASCRREEPLAPQLEKLAKAREKTAPEHRIMLDDKGNLRRREIELLVNIIAPDPRYQPWFLADEASIYAVRDQGEKTIRPRLEGYFGRPLKFELRKRQPLWELVDDIKKAYPDWPDSWD